MLHEHDPPEMEQLIRLPGQQYDEETGLYYNRYRYYDPAQRRYITEDPIGLRGGWNIYQYPLDPVRYIDILGLKTYMCNRQPGKFTCDSYVSPSLKSSIRFV